MSQEFRPAFYGPGTCGSFASFLPSVSSSGSEYICCPYGNHRPCDKRRCMACSCLPDAPARYFGEPGPQDHQENLADRWAHCPRDTTCRSGVQMTLLPNLRGPFYSAHALRVEGISKVWARRGCRRFRHITTEMYLKRSGRPPAKECVGNTETGHVPHCGKVLLVPLHLQT